jgi:hypothetical protein
MLSKLFSALSGRTTTFSAAFFVIGNVLHWLHRLDATYISYMGVLMGFVIGHSIKEDITKPKGCDDDPKGDDPKGPQS